MRREVVSVFCVSCVSASPAAPSILEEVVSNYAPVVKEFETDILEVEATVFSGAVAPTERIYSLRRQATGFHRIVHPLLAVVTTVKRTIAPPELQPYLRDVEDDLLLASEDVAAQRDLLLWVMSHTTHVSPVSGSLWSRS